MKTTFSLACTLIAAAFVSQAAMAQGIKIRGGTSNNSYELNVTPAAAAGYNFATATYTGTNYGVTFLTSDSTYIDIAGSNGSGTYNRPTYIGDLSRSDLAFVFGVNFGDTTSNIGNLYVGYKTGETKLDPPTSAPAGSSHLNFKANGLVTGGGLIIPLGGAGALGLNLGLGLMSGKYDLHNNGSTTTTTYNADYALGYSYGIGYSYPFTQNFGISLDYKANSYTYTFNAGLTTENSLEEKFNSTVGSLYVKF
jgi:hypothetical protein